MNINKAFSRIGKVGGYVAIAIVFLLIAVQLFSCTSIKKARKQHRQRIDSTAVRSYAGNSRLQVDSSAWLRLLDTGTRRSTSQYGREVWQVKAYPSVIRTVDTAMLIGPAAARFWDSAHAVEWTYTREWGQHQSEEKAGKDSSSGSRSTTVASRDTAAAERIQVQKDSREKSSTKNIRKFAAGILPAIGIIALIALFLYMINRGLKATRPL